MDSDKNYNSLEKQLKTLGQKIRIDILKKLKNSKIPISFSKLQKEVIQDNNTSVNFSFHLNTLKSCDLIDSCEDGYSISPLGIQILNKILSIEQILNEKSKVKMIRTSKYSKEVFNINKIEEYLIKEGEVEPSLAREIAQEVEERLSKTKIKYLTAPLMREYINAILLENGLEEVRHKLTRLGTPPYEVFKLFNSKNNNINPEHFIKKLGSDVSEQFLLLNLLPKDLADLYLSGEIALLHLNYWSLRPLSLYLTSDSILNFIFKDSFKSSKKLRNSRDYTNLILNFFDVVSNFYPYFSQDIVLGNFNNHFLSCINFHKHLSYFYNIIKTKIFKFNNLYGDSKSHLSLHFTLNDNESSIDLSSNQFDMITEFLNFKSKKLYLSNLDIQPLILLDYSKFNILQLNSTISANLTSVIKDNDVIFYHGDSSKILNSNLVKIKEENENQIILDKILINLDSISFEANRNDDLFNDLLMDKVDAVFDFFKYKTKLTKKKLNFQYIWKYLINEFFGESNNQLYENMLKSISFFGLHNAVLQHCGIDFDRLKESERFALKVISLMSKLINEKNAEENTNYLLTQPHKDNYLIDAWQNSKHSPDESNCYSSNIIRKGSQLPLEKKIELFKKFEKIINGGIIFNQICDLNETSIMEILPNLFKSKLEAIYIDK